jgi:hypothetical protein
LVGIAEHVPHALRSEAPPTFRYPPRLSKLDPFKEVIHRLPRADLQVPAVMVRERTLPLRFDGGRRSSTRT